MSQGAFPLIDLPLAVLGNTFFFLSVKEAAKTALTCKKFLQAFRDETTWRRRAISVMGLEAATEAYRKTSLWMSAFRSFFWTVHINTLFRNRGGCRISSKFHVQVSPNMSVAAFVRFLDSHPKNPQGRGPRAQDSLVRYKPFSPADLFYYSPLEREKISLSLDVKPNCKFRVPKTMREAETITIQDAGLCDGAVLSQAETMMFD